MLNDREAGRAGRHPQFRPTSPRSKCPNGVSCGKYLTDRLDQYPASWFARAKLSPSGRQGTILNR